MRVFISHSSKDDAIVRQLRLALEALHIEVWTDSERLKGGDQLTPEIRQAIHQSTHFLAVLSLDALNSDWVQKEIAEARAAAKPVIPLMRPGIEPAILRLLFGGTAGTEEPVGIRLDNVSDALPHIAAALGLQLPTEVLHRARIQAAPIADLVLELSFPTFDPHTERAAATAVLRCIPSDEAPPIESPPYTFTAPIGPIETEEIAWYLERYVNWPRGVFDDRAMLVVESLPKWGRLIYDAVNTDDARESLEAWKSDRAGERRFTVRVNRAIPKDKPKEDQDRAAEAATALLALPWELIHDERGFLFQGARPVRVRRSLPNRFRQPALATEPPIRVLLVSPRPEDDSAAYIDHRVSARPLVDSLSQLGDLAQFKLLEPPSFPALEAELARARQANEPYHVVHFDGHGVWNRRHGLGQLCFEDPADESRLERRRSQLIDAENIARVMRDHRIPLFFLEACQTAKTDTDPSASVAGRLLESGIASVAAMSHSVLVETARLFIAEFYKEVLSGKRVGQAMLAGQRALNGNTLRGRTFTGEVHLQDWFVPVLFQEVDDPQVIRDVPSEQVQAIWEEQAELALGDLPDPPSHLFLGRSRDLLKAERLLARERYVVVRGSGGEGKTTFAAELARWLVATRRFDRAACTSVEQITEAKQVLFAIGGQLVPNFAVQAGADEETGRQLAERALREHRTVLVIDNMESLLDHESLAEILALCKKLGGAGDSRLIFTTREALPVPFDRNVVEIRRLDRQTAIRLVANVLERPPAAEETEEDLAELVDAVCGHARSLVLIAREVGEAGVRHAVKNLREVLRSIESNHPGERENSLLASAELSLRRLAPEVRELIRPLAVFRGGGLFGAIRIALKIDEKQVVALAQALIAVGLAEHVKPQYLRFDPALFGGELSSEQRDQAMSAWADAVAGQVDFLYQDRYQDPEFAAAVTRLDLPNLLAALEYLGSRETAERVVDLATSLEPLLSAIGNPKALARVVALRTAAERGLTEWSHARFLASQAAIKRMIEQGRFAEAVRMGHSLLDKAEAAGPDAYNGAAYDMAMGEITLGSALKESGDAQNALAFLHRARVRFEAIGEQRMASVALTERADCFTALGRYDEAEAAYGEAIRIDEERGDSRAVAVGKGQLATTRYLQRDHLGALKMYEEARTLFERLNEPRSVGVVCHQTGNVLQAIGEYEAAEDAYQRSLELKLKMGDLSGQASTLGALGNLNAQIGRRGTAVRLFRRAADIYFSIGDLRFEGIARNNIALNLIALERQDEARRELERAVECKKPFGHVAQPWTTFDILTDLERAVGNETAALAARDQAIAAYLAHRRDGGEPDEEIPDLPPDLNPADPALPYRYAAEILLRREQQAPRVGERE